MDTLFDMALTLYGIPNCDTVKKARDWLDSHKIGYEFHNYKTDGIDAARLKTWVKALGWEKVLNKGSTTYQALPPSEKDGLNEAKAIKLMVAQPSMIRRPIWDADGQLFAGFKPNSPDRTALEKTLIG
jgi:arsenate reductase